MRFRSSLRWLGVVGGGLCLLCQSALASEQGKSKLPLENTDLLRTFTLSTDEATWISVDVSPDDQTLVIDVLGDLFTLPATGGSAQQLTSGMAFDSQPAYSPDGKHIAFISDRDGAENVWIVATESADGSAPEPKQLTKDSTSDFMSPTWSADSDYVIYSRVGKGQRTNELWMVHREGGSGVQITKASPTPGTPRDRQHNAAGAAASSDGRYLYYARKFGGFSYNADFPMWQVARRDLVDGVEDVLTSAQGSAIRPAISPDCETLVFATRLDNQTGFKVRNLVSGEERWLKYPVTRDDQESRATRDVLPGYSFTSDGTALIASWGGKLHRLDVATGDSTPIPFSVNVEQKLGPRLVFPRRTETGPVRARTAQGAERSPADSVVVFSALTRIYRTDEGTDEPARLLSAPGQRAFQPTFSPDGDWVVYVTWQREGGHVWRVPAAGGTPQRLTATAAFYAEPSVSPDGARVVFRRGSRSDRLEMPAEFGGSPIPLDLGWVDANRTDQEVNLIAPSRGLGRPHFGPEADRVYVASGEGLVSMRFDGSDKRVHLQVVGPGLYFASEPVPASDIRIRPDGKWAIARASNRFYAVAIPRIGGDPPKVNVEAPSVPVKELSELGADGMGWIDGGESIGWTVGPSYFTTAFADLEFAKSESGAEDESEGDGEAEPDESADDDPGSAEKDGAQASNEPEFPDSTRTELVVELARAAPEGSVVLRGARVVTMAENAADGGVVENADVVITGNRIVAVGRTGAVPVPPDAEVIDVSGKTILPGFVDTHAHWTEIRRGVLDTEAWPFLASMAWGVTTGLDVQTMTNDMFAYQDLIDAGELIGPRAFNTGPGIFSDNAFKSKAHVERVLRRYRDQYRTRNLKAYISGNRKQRQWIVEVRRNSR